MKTSRHLSTFTVIPILSAIGLIIPKALGQGLAQVTVVNIMDQIKGDTSCIAKAERRYMTWKTYNDSNNRTGQNGGSISRKDMHPTADRHFRARWTARAPRTSASGRVEGARNTKFGSSGKDIGAMYEFDWTVFSVYGWGSSRQPRVESVTVIELKHDCAANIKLTNEISMTGKAVVTGTAGVANPWEQIAYARATLSAVDVKGGNHQLKVNAEATVSRSASKQSSSGISTTNSWSVTGTASGGEDGVGGSVTGNLSGSTTRSQATSVGESVPTIPGATHSPKPYQKTVKCTHTLNCGGKLEFGRVAQISGEIFTSSGSPQGKVQAQGNFIVQNTVEIVVECIPCSGGVPVPTGPGTPTPGKPVGGGHGSNGGASGTGSLPREPYGDVPDSPLTPRTRGGVTYTPSHGGAWWEHPIIKNGGCIYIEPGKFPPVIFPLSEEEAENFSPLDLPTGKIPLVVPEDSEGSHVPLGHLVLGAQIQPTPGTLTRVGLGINHVIFEGTWSVVDPTTGHRTTFDFGYLDYREGGVLDIAGDYFFDVPTGYELLEELNGGLHTFTCVDPASGRIAGTASVDPSNPNLIYLGVGYHQSDGEQFDIPDVALRLEHLLTDGVVSSVRFYSESQFETVRLLTTFDLSHWFPVAVSLPDPSGMVEHDEAFATMPLPNLGQRYYSAGFQLEKTGETIHLPDPLGYLEIAKRLPGMPYLQPHERGEFDSTALDYWNKYIALSNLQIDLRIAEQAGRDGELLIDALTSVLNGASPQELTQIQSALDAAVISNAPKVSAIEPLQAQVDLAEQAYNTALDRIAFNRANFPAPIPANPAARQEVILAFLHFVTTNGGDIGLGSEWIPILEQVANPFFPGASDSLFSLITGNQPVCGQLQAEFARISMHHQEINAQLCWYGDGARLFLPDEDGSVNVFSFYSDFGLNASRY